MQRTWYIQNWKEDYGLDLFVQPNIEYDDIVIEEEYSKTTKGGSSKFLKSWPPKSNNIQNPFDWYKKWDYSQLEDALKHVAEMEGLDKKIRIAHIDTGYYPQHPSTPENVNAYLSKSFIRGEAHNKGILKVSGKGQPTHGIATLGILAGKHVEPRDPIFKTYKGVMGAIPFAEIICLRIAEKVHLTDGQSLNAFAKAVEYAIDEECKVITMSMGGLSNEGMAKVVNKAYEKGVVFVAAAGNNFNTFWDIVIPEQMVYPARYHRVIAATGVAYNQYPYDFKAQEATEKGGFDGERMQGNSGPQSLMSNAIAAYTPNVPWADI